MTAEIHDAKGFVAYLAVANPPAHVYCDTCGDCIVCYPHGVEEWCSTGERWVLYADMEDDAEIIALLKRDTNG